MKRRAIVAVLVLGLWTANAIPVKASDKNSQAAKVLNDSYESARNLDVEERGYYLARLTQVAAKVSHVKTADWCQEQYNLAANPIPGVKEWQRIATLKNALTAWSWVDAKKSIELLDALSRTPAPPYPDSTVITPEDLRASASGTIFPNFWREAGPSGLTKIEKIEKIENVANQIGNSGEYPYRPMLFIMEEVKRSDPKELKSSPDNIINDIFIAALTSYERAKKIEFANEDTEFVSMLEGAQLVVPETLFKQALDSFVQRLLKDLSKPTSNFAANVITSKGVVHFDNKRELLLFRIFPLIDRFDHPWAQQLYAEHSEILEHAGDQGENFQLGIIEGPATQEQLARFRQQMEQQVAAEKIKLLEKANPWGALEVAEKLPANGRILMSSNILESMVHADPSKAAEIYARQREDLKAVEGDSKPNLPARIALAKAAFYMRDVNTFSEFVIKSFDSGVALFEKSDKVSFSRPGYNELTGLVEFCTMHGVTWILDTIHNKLQSSDPMLEAHLLVAAAKGITEQIAKTNSMAATPQGGNTEGAKSKNNKVVSVRARIPKDRGN